MKRFLFAQVSLFLVTLGSGRLLAQSVDDGIALFKAGKSAEARAVFTPLADRDPVAAFYLGQIEMGDNADDKAADWFEKAVKMSTITKILSTDKAYSTT